MATNNITEQLSLPLANRSREPNVADADVGDVVNEQWHSLTRRRRSVRRVPLLPSDLTDDELLTTVLGPSNALACQWLTTTHDGFRAVAQLGPADLSEHGFTTGAIDKLGAVFEIAKRYGEQEFRPGEPLRSSADIYAHYRERLGAETREHFYGVLLDNKHRKIRDVLLSLGSLTASIVQPRDCFAQVLRHAAAAVAFVHNLWGASHKLCYVTPPLMCSSTR